MLGYENKAFPVFYPEGEEPDQKAVQQLRNCLQHDRAVAGALMADHHLGYSMPIGGVVAYEDGISPTGVGFDIACGNMAVKTNLRIGDILPEQHEWPPKPDVLYQSVKPIMREIQKRVEFGVGRKNATPVDDPVMEQKDVWYEIDRVFGPDLQAKARAQLGTVGSGNHYVDLLVDDQGWIWTANHFGSRGLGHTIASGFMAAAQGVGFKERVKETDEGIVIPTDTELGEFYIAAMHLAGAYAYAGRESVTKTVLEILGAEAQVTVHNHHNFAWLEEGLWVVRKGATPLGTELAFIGGSMGDVSVIVRGAIATGTSASEFTTVVGVEDIGALGSAPHGAGRVMSRTAAAGKMKKVWQCSNRDCVYSVRTDDAVFPLSCPEHGEGKFRKVRVRDAMSGLVDWDRERYDLTDRGIVVLGAGADEAPPVYKCLPDVIRAHPNIEVVETLRPIGVVMAGPDTFDPYKD